jgi:hypothetical protein
MNRRDFLQVSALTAAVAFAGASDRGWATLPAALTGFSWG